MDNMTDIEMDLFAGYYQWSFKVPSSAYVQGDRDWHLEVWKLRRKTGIAYRKIADRLELPVSGSRVQQILYRVERTLRNFERNDNKRRFATKIYNIL